MFSVILQLLRETALCMAAVLLLINSAAAQEGNAELEPDKIIVSDIRVGVHPRKTRFVLDLSEHVDYRIFTLADPYRVVIDLPEISWRIKSRTLPQKAGLIDGLRFGAFRPGVSRVVLDLKGPIKITSSFIIPPAGAKRHRFVLDLVETEREAFITGLRPPPKFELARRPKTREAPNSFVPGRKPRQGAVKKHVVIIDPGHGGIDPGATGKSGVREKNITLSAARDFKRIMEGSGRYKVFLTRSRDTFIRLRDRIAIARDKGAELFISIHADTIPRRKIRGLSVYTLSENASDQEAADLADKENKSDLIAGIDLTAESKVVTNILIDLAQRESMNESSRFAGYLVTELKKVTRLLTNAHRFAGFAVLKAPDVPSILMELGFLSNAKDERNLKDKRYRGKLGKAILNAVDEFFSRIEQAKQK